MLKKDIFRSKKLALAVLVAVVFLVVPLGTFAADQETELETKSSLRGFAFKENRKIPLAGAVVTIRNTANQKEFVSEPTDATGSYTISGIDSGWYFLRLSTEEGVYNLGKGFFLRAGEVAQLSVALKQDGDLEGWGRAFAAKKSFLRTSAGIAVVVVGVAGAGFGLSQAFKKESDHSPVLIR